jgi:hypothetical protein
MKRISWASAITLLTLTSASSFADGPFGVNMGTPVENYKACQPKDTAGYYRCSTLPRTHEDIEYYIIESWPATGVCFVKGMGNTISIDVYGTTLRAKVDEIAAQMSETYGRADKNDFLGVGSIWKDPRDWSMAILKNERYYSYNWSNKTGASLKDGIAKIYVGARGLTTDKGYVVVEFYFQNEPNCNNAERKAKAKAF